MRYVLLDTLGRMVTGPLGASVSFTDYEKAARAALRRVEPTRVAELRVVLDPTDPLRMN